MSNKINDSPSYESVLPTTRAGKLAWGLERIAGFAVLLGIAVAPFYYAGSAIYDTYRSIQSTQIQAPQVQEHERFTSYPRPIKEPSSKS